MSLLWYSGCTSPRGFVTPERAALRRGRFDGEFGEHSALVSAMAIVGVFAVRSPGTGRGQGTPPAGTKVETSPLELARDTKFKLSLTRRVEVILQYHVYAFHHKTRTLRWPNSSAPGEEPRNTYGVCPFRSCGKRHTVACSDIEAITLTLALAQPLP